MGARHLLQSFDAWRAAGEPLVLATVYETAGSTYSKAGHRILLAANGDYRGLVSGGCLEGDLAERARVVVATARPPPSPTICAMRPTSSGASASAATGCCACSCSRCCATNDYQPFGAIAEALCGHARGGRRDRHRERQAGRRRRRHGRRRRDRRARVRCRAPRARRCCALPGAPPCASRCGAVRRAEHGCRILHAPLQPMPKLLVLGGGLDAIPLVSMAAELGWFVTVADHRPGYLARGGFERAERAVLVEPERLAASLPLARFRRDRRHEPPSCDGSQVSRASSRAWTAVISACSGRARVATVCSRSFADVAPRLRERLKGPVGLDIGADSPESIALSILAELQVTL